MGNRRLVHAAALVLWLGAVAGCLTAPDTVQRTAVADAKVSIGEKDGASPAVAKEQMVPAAETVEPFEAVELPPVDESEKDPDFARFWQAFRKAVAARDAAGLLALTDPGVRTGFGEENGVELFRKEWGLDRDPQASPLWPLLSDIISLGGTFTEGDPGLFRAPYVYSRFPDRFDAFTHMAVVRRGARVRVEPRLDAGVVAVVDHLVVRHLEIGKEQPTAEVDGRTYSWVKVGLPSGKAGYLLSRDLWSPVGYRAGFARKEGAWRMTFLVTGD